MFSKGIPVEIHFTIVNKAKRSEVWTLEGINMSCIDLGYVPGGMYGVVHNNQYTPAARLNTGRYCNSIENIEGSICTH